MGNTLLEFKNLVTEFHTEGTTDFFLEKGKSNQIYHLKGKSQMFPNALAILSRNQIKTFICYFKT